MDAPKKSEGIRVVAENRRAKLDYQIDETIEAGISLLGSEVKALREGQIKLADAYVYPKDGELFLLNAHIGPYKPSAAFAHEPTRTRKLLLHREEIDRWAAKVRERGYSIVPLMVYFKDGRAKVRLGLAKGKKLKDRREQIKKRDMEREIERALRR